MRNKKWPIYSPLLIRRRSDYIIGFIAPAIGPNKSKKLTRLITPAHNIRGKVWMRNNIHSFTGDLTCLWSMYVVVVVFFYSNFVACIVYRRYKPCEFLGFVWTDCWGNKSYYVITSPANYGGIFIPVSSIKVFGHSIHCERRRIYLGKSIQGLQNDTIIISWLFSLRVIQPTVQWHTFKTVMLVFINSCSLQKFSKAVGYQST